MYCAGRWLMGSPLPQARYLTNFQTQNKRELPLWIVLFALAEQCFFPSKNTSKSATVLAGRPCSHIDTYSAYKFHLYAHTRRAHEEAEAEIESTDGDAERDSDAEDVKVTEDPNGVHVIEPVHLEPTTSKNPPKTFLEIQKERKQRRQETFVRKSDGTGGEQANTGNKFNEEDTSGNQVIQKLCRKNVHLIVNVLLRALIRVVNVCT